MLCLVLLWYPLFLGLNVPLPTRVDNMGGVYPYLDNFYPDKHGLDNMTPPPPYFLTSFIKFYSGKCPFLGVKTISQNGVPNMMLSRGICLDNMGYTVCGK